MVSVNVLLLLGAASVVATNLLHYLLLTWREVLVNYTWCRALRREKVRQSVQVLRDLLTVNEFNVVSDIVKLVGVLAALHPGLLMLLKRLTLDGDDADVIDVALGCLLS